MIEKYLSVQDTLFVGGLIMSLIKLYQLKKEGKLW